MTTSVRLNAVKLTCFNCLDGLHRRCRQKDCACSICAVSRPRKLKPRPKLKKPGPRRKYEGPRDWPTNQPMTESEKDEVAAAILRLYQGFASAGYYAASFDRKPKKDHLGSTPKEEGDYICDMLVGVLEKIAEKQRD